MTRLNGIAAYEQKRKKDSDLMMISTRGRYALRTMIDLAEHYASGEYVPLKEIAARQEISEKYLESIVRPMNQNDLLEGVKGKGGGYRLSHQPSEITVGTILRLVEGNLITVSCLDEGHDCNRQEVCRALPLWRKLDDLVSGFLDSVTLEDLMEKK